MSTRDRIAEVALQLFSERGYDAVGVAELATRSGSTKPTIYHHFGSKLGLLETLLRERFEDWLERLADIAQYRHDLPSNIYRLILAFFQFSQESPHFVRLQWSLWLSPRDSTAHAAVRPFLLQQHALLEQLFIDAIPDHGNLRGHHRHYALVLSGMLAGYVSAAPQLGQTLLEQDAYRLSKQFMYGIYAL
ncbi:MAG: TetR/AcrR family transcriptional regulator [Myxococcota bacterium]|jgi:TetR/AcrR family transcriptional regulator|nr:TetR/AcrR family transcriptional regulator [Myxococcota bacterium]